MAAAATSAAAAPTTADQQHQQQQSQGPSSPSPAPDPIDSIEPSSSLATDDEEKSSSVQNSTEQPLSVKDGSSLPGKVPDNANIMDKPMDSSCHLGNSDEGGNFSAVDQTVVSAPQAQPVFYRGYENASGEWDDYSRFINFESFEAASPGVYNENPSLIFHTGYGYSPQMPPYGPYSPVTTPLPSANGDNQLYSQRFPFPGPYYQQPPPPSTPYLASPNPMSQPDLAMPVDHHGSFLADNFNSSSMLFGPRSDYPLPHNAFGTENFTGNSSNPRLYELPQGFDGPGTGGFWSDWMRSPDGAGSATSLSSPAASPQPVGAFGSFGQGIGPVSSAMAIQQQRPFHGFGTSLRSYDRGYFHGGMYHQGSNFGGSLPRLGNNRRSFTAIDRGRREKGNLSLCNCNGALDFLNEQNRGPRSTRPKNVSVEPNVPVESKKSDSAAQPDHELYNRPDFSIEYKDAKFFIIKSYSEDNVHKSIKYGVWASTTNGNRKLDSAYREAKEKADPCPIFLFFSVNASAQFCGVAEMIGPVDFEKSVSYWQQDKWTGQFPVRWHIIKDVPNNLFRHIIVENNDNKPVTNSRDTQEVKLDQGLEMLTIFKKHEADMSIIDDFDFYEEREKAMQERKTRQQQLQSNSTGPISSGAAAAAREFQYPSVPKPSDEMNQISRTFADVVRLDEAKTGESKESKNSSSSSTTAAHPAASVTKPAEDSEQPAATSAVEQ